MRIFVSYGRTIRRGDRDQRGGGTSTAVLSLCRALAQRGHDLHLFARCQDPGNDAGMTIHDRTRLAGIAASCPPDGLVVVPPLLPLLMPVPARTRIAWLHDNYATGGCAITARWRLTTDAGPMERAARLYSMAVLHPYVDRIVVGSHWHAEDVRGSANIAPDAFAIIPLGAPLEHYDGPAPERHPHRLIYTSRSNRGLDMLLRLFPHIRAAIADAELHIFGYEYDGASPAPQFEGLEQPGVCFRGGVDKRTLAGELRASAVMAYPSTFRETFCISIAEAQAAGLPVVATDFAAIRERIHDGVDGFLIPGEVESPTYASRFVHSVVELLTDGNLRSRMGAAAVTKARQLYDWDGIAAQWEGLLQRLVRDQDLHAPQLDPALDLLDPALLVVHDEIGGYAPPELARKWLRKAWTACGYGVETVPGLQRRADLPFSGVGERRDEV